jgi:quinol monooxygenase YgiN
MRDCAEAIQPSATRPMPIARAVISSGKPPCGRRAPGVASMPFGTIKRRTRMYASLRTYRIGSGSVDAVMRRVDRDFAEALSQEPGFVAYHAIDTGNDMVMTISLFHDREQAKASNELAAQWVAEELSDFNVTRVGVIGGEAMVSRASAEILEPAQP